MVTRHFCTYFDYRYLTRGLALYESLARHCPQFCLWVLCLDDVCRETLTSLQLPHLRLIRLEELEHQYPELLGARENRNPLEYYYTCTPALAAYVLQREPAAELITYLDADLYFFSSPEPLFEELGDRSIAIIGHRYTEELRHFEKSAGLYNVSWVSFRRDEEGLACLNRWRQQCIEWCYDYPANGRYGDQKYLDDWPQEYSRVVVLSHPGAGVAPWNANRYRLTQEKGQLMSDGLPLIFFHFHALRRVNHAVYDPTCSHFKTNMTTVLRRQIYGSYIRKLQELSHRVLSGQPEASYHGDLRREIYPTLQAGRFPGLQWLRNQVGIGRWLLKGRYLLVLRVG